MTWAFSDDVRMVLVVDGEGVVRNVRPQDLDAAGLSVERAFELAAANLGRSYQAGAFQFGVATLVDGTSIGMARGNWMAPAGALMIGDFHQMLRQHLAHDDFAAVAANQECLLAFATDERTLASQSLRQAVDDMMQHRKPISRSWLRIDGAWPTAHPLTGSFDGRRVV